MANRDYKIYDESYPYFITTSIRFGLPLFSDPGAVQIVLENIRFLRKERGVNVFAYVIMANHTHAIMQGTDLKNKISRFKSYSARKIGDLFRERGRSRWLKRLKKVKPEHKTDRHFQFWEESFHPKQIEGDDMMDQKITYIHQNPVKRGYVDKPEHWRYSSARNYLGSEGLIEIDGFEGRIV
ncbi:transposase [Aliifodinibius sp. S!AR15-10]|uniref:REP-associated tyrosine transposase n=1 Tax=Aliifodinibius sp. S!AR15-10 TaxID=2950437 RepID=UPI0028546701|nr:transposase [Aliifodinibius sp. S!AR15-10]MDR8391405.1 transposase [Aliifodinibius sp. S!AR15-10]